MAASIINDRKIEHIAIVQNDEQTDRRRFYFDQVRLTHRALPEMALADVDTSTDFLGKRLSFPLLISAMTGGDHSLMERINRNLALAAEATGVAMGVGSQRVMFSNPAAKRSFSLRRHAPNTVLLSNLGAVQLNHGFGLEHCQQAVEVLEADALCLHLNPLQELAQPEGDTDFRGLAEKIGQIAHRLTVPVIVKEVGCGLSPADARLLLEQHIRYLDVAGSGGTSWSRIEHHRHESSDGYSIGLAFEDWGIPAPLAIRQLRRLSPETFLIGSGGIRHGIDMVKAMALGAGLCGLAAPFLKPAMQSAERVIEAIERLRKEFRTAMFILGMANTRQLVGNDALLLPE